MGPNYCLSGAVQEKRSLQAVIWLRTTEKEVQWNGGVNLFFMNRLAPGGESQLFSKEEPMRGFPGLA